MKKLFRNNAKPPKPTPLPPPTSSPPTPVTTLKPQFPSLSSNSSISQGHPQTPSSVHGHQSAYQPSQRSPSQDGTPDTWVVVEEKQQQPQQPPTLFSVRPQPSFDSQSSLLANLPPGASPPNPYQQQPQQQQPPYQPPPQHPQPPPTVPRRSHRSDSVNGHNQAYQPPHPQTSSSENIYEASIMSGQEKQKKGGLFGWVAELSHDKDRDRERHAQQAHMHQQYQMSPPHGQNHNSNWDLTRIMG
jgi:hypothetical protein